MTFELVPNSRGGYAELRVDGMTVARIDLMLLEALHIAAKDGSAPLWLAAVTEPAEAVSRPGKAP